MAKRVFSVALNYLWAIMAVAFATVMIIAFRPWITPSITPTITPLLLGAVMVAAWIGGVGPGLLAAILGSIIMNAFFFAPAGAISIGASEIIRTLLFLGTAAFINSLVEARRRAENAEHTRRLWYEGMLTSVGDGVIGTDARGRVSFLNTAAEELTGWSSSDAEGKPVDEVLTIRYDKVGSPVLGPAERAMRVGKPVALGPGNSVLLVDRSGRRQPLDGLAAPIRTPNGEPAGVVFVFRDVTAQRRAEEAVAELATIVASSHDAIIVKGTDDQITAWNPGAERLFGYTASEVMGRPITMLAPPDRTDEMPRIQTSIENGVAISHFETQRMRKDNRRIDISMSVSALKDSDGKIVGTASIARDVTERRQDERRLAAQYAVGRILADSSTLTQAMPRLLEAIGVKLQWEIGLCWSIDRATDELRCSAIWHRAGPGYERFARTWGAKTFAKGDGLPGKVWAEGEPCWIARIADDSDFAQMGVTAAQGPRGGVAFPIRSGDNVLGVIEFLTGEVFEFEKPMLGMLQVVGNQVGQFIERKRAEADLRIAEARFRCLADSGILGIMIADIDEYVIRDANDTYLGLIGATRDDLTNGRIDWRTMIAPEFRDADDRAIAQLRVMGVCDPFIKDYIGLGGKRVSVLIGLARLEENASLCIGFLIDVTEHRRTEQVLRHREEQLRMALDVAGMGTWDWKVSTGATEWSENLEAIHGVAPHTFDGRFETFMSLVHPDDQSSLRLAIEKAFSGESEYDKVFRIVAHDGTIRWVNGRGRVFRDEQGQPVRMIGVSLDVTEQKRAQEELEKANEVAVAANLAKNQFLAVLSHELRTPLTPVLAAVTAMLEDPGTPPDFRAVLQMIRRNVELEARLIDDLLDITRISQGKLRLVTEVVDAHELLYQALDICMTEVRDKGLRLDVGFHATSHFVKADPARLQQVFWNLIKNAVKFTPSEGMLSVRTLTNESGHLVVQVIDNGRGIEPESLPKIFNAFEQGEASVTRRFGGLGLGLAISRSVIEALGGRISAQSQGRDQGATFSIELTSVTPPSVLDQAEKPSHVSSDGVVGPFRILLVEDNEDSLKILSRLLRLKGHSVATANSVASAADVATDHSFDILVSDIGLPDGTGFDVIRMVHEREPLPAIALSGYGMESDLQNTRDAGFTAHMIKPIDIQTLENTLVNVIAQHRSREKSL